MVVHGMGNRQDVSDLALNAGLDMDLGSECYMQNLANSVEQKRISPEQIDLACRRILEAKYKLGLFADPYKYCDTSGRQNRSTPAPIGTPRAASPRSRWCF